MRRGRGHLLLRRSAGVGELARWSDEGGGLQDLDGPGVGESRGWSSRMGLMCDRPTRVVLRCPGRGSREMRRYGAMLLRAGFPSESSRLAATTEERPMEAWQWMPTRLPVAR